MDFLSRLQHNIQEQELFGPSDQLLLAVSGGRDSVALLSALHHLGYSVAIAHCNFQLRSEESLGDEKFVQELAERLSVPFYLQRFDTALAAQSSGQSIQMIARQLRYDWLEKIRTEHSFQYVLTAHHQDDSVETVLLNLVKGTGLAGLHGILPKRNKIVRPFLCFSREDIGSYVDGKALLWREDSSNSLDKYERNFLRLRVLPLLKELNPKVSQSIATTSKRLSDIEKYVASALEEEKKKLMTAENGYVLLSLFSLRRHPSPHLLLYAALCEFGFSHQVLDEILASKQTGAVFHSTSHRVLLDRECLILDKKQTENCLPVQIPNSNTVSILIGGKIVTMEETTSWTYNKTETLLALDKIQFPLSIRKWEEGDTFRPLGMAGQKKLSDFLIDSKVHLFAKEKTLVVESAGKIAAVLGMRPSEDFKVDANTKTALRFTVA